MMEQSELSRLIEVQTRFLRTLKDALGSDREGEASDLSAPTVAGVELGRFDIERTIDGPMSAVLGSEFQVLDERKHRLRLPRAPFLLMDRVLRLEGNRMGLGEGRIEWEFTIPPRSFLSQGEDVSPLLLVESSHSILLLLAYLGYDQCLGPAGRFRALSNASTFRGSRPDVGSRYRGITVIEGVVRTKEQVLFRLKTEGYLDDVPVLSSRWQAGLFSAAFLDQRHQEMPQAPLPRESFQAEALAIPSRFHLLQSVLTYDPHGGHKGLGEIWLKAQLNSLDWVLDCHFPHDPVFPGILAVEAACQGLALLAWKKSWIKNPDTIHLRAGSGTMHTRFLGEIRPQHEELLLQLTLTACGRDIQADARVYCDGRFIGEAQGLTLARSTADVIPIQRHEARRLGLCLEDGATPLIITRDDGNLVLKKADGSQGLAFIPAFQASDFGNAQFRELFGVTYACMLGGMAHGIASLELVIRAARAGFLASYGAAGLSLDTVLQAIDHIQKAIPNQSFAVNFIQQTDAAQEWKFAQALVARGIHLIEASAFVRPTAALVYYRCQGLREDARGIVHVKNRIIAKISRPEIAAFFVKPAPAAMLDALQKSGHITEEEARCARKISMVDALTVEADSGGHTDNRPLTSVFPLIQKLVWDTQRTQVHPSPLFLGLGGGIGCPEAVHAAFAMGADYVVTGSINQATVEAGTSMAVKESLLKAGLGDMAMAPSADMFEQGARVQVLRGSSIFALRAQKLYQMYLRYRSIDEALALESEFLQGLWKKPWEAVWKETREFWSKRNPAQVDAALNDPKIQMALVFRWYLGKSIHWALQGDPDRREDYQIWCGPAMAACNGWLRGSPLEPLAARHVDTLTLHLLKAAAFHHRCQALQQLAPAVRSALSYSFGDSE